MLQSNLPTAQMVGAVNLKLTNMKFLKLLPVVLLVCLMACGDDENGKDDINAVNCANFGNDAEVQAAIQAFSDAATAYGENPTEETCNNYLDALDAYFVSIDEYIDACYNDEAWEDYKDAVEEWRAERDQLDCQID